MEHIAFPQTLPELTSPASVTDDVKGPLGRPKERPQTLEMWCFHGRVGIVAREGTSQQRDTLSSPKIKEAAYLPRTQGR